MKEEITIATTMVEPPSAVELSVQITDNVLTTSNVWMMVATAVSVHLTCEIWGTLAVGIFGDGIAIMPQVYGVLAIGAIAFISALTIFKLLQVTIGIRVSEAHEAEGLDSHGHGIRGYVIIVE